MIMMIVLWKQFITFNFLISLSFSRIKDVNICIIFYRFSTVSELRTVINNAINKSYIYFNARLQLLIRPLF
jgi:hypothetical protein